jgi:hypothetical protein
MDNELRKEFREALGDLKGLIEGVRLHVSSSSDHLIGRVEAVAARIESLVKIMDGAK